MWSTDHETYGKTRDTKTTLTHPVTGLPFEPGLRQQGQYEDQETGLYQNCYRFYEPNAGRYISQDPIGLMGGLNAYRYCPNPVGYVDPLGLESKECPKVNPRNLPGTATGSGVDVGDRWLRGAHGNAGLMPRQVAEQLQGRDFNSFDDFRKAFWQAVGNDPSLSSQFNQSNITRMRNGNSPFVHPTQSLGQRGVYELHHRTPIQHGGEVYNMDNLMITTPRYHKEVLATNYHF